MVALIFLFLSWVASHAKSSLSPQFETSQIGPGSTALEICLQSLYWKNRPHVPFDPVQYRAGGPELVTIFVPNRSPGVRREIPPTEQDAITTRMPFTFDDDVQSEIDRATGKVRLYAFKGTQGPLQMAFHYELYQNSQTLTHGAPPRRDIHCKNLRWSNGI
jgi:hypothetical protein